MKHLLALSLVLFLAAVGKTQPYGIMNLRIDPASPTERDTIEARVQLIFSTLQNLIGTTDTLIDGTIHLELRFCGGFLPAIDVREETVPIGPLPAGQYTLVCRVLEYGPAWDDDGMITDTCHLAATYLDSLSFAVDLLDRATHPAPAMHVDIFPNPAREFIYLQADAPIRSVQLWAPGGQALRHWGPLFAAGSKLFLPELSGGLYFLQIRSYDGQQIWKRLLVQ